MENIKNMREARQDVVNGKKVRTCFRFCGAKKDDGTGCGKKFTPTGKYTYYCEDCLTSMKSKARSKRTKKHQSGKPLYML